MARPGWHDTCWEGAWGFGPLKQCGEKAEKHPAFWSIHSAGIDPKIIIIENGQVNCICTSFFSKSIQGPEAQLRDISRFLLPPQVALTETYGFAHLARHRKRSGSQRRWDSRWPFVPSLFNKAELKMATRFKLLRVKSKRIKWRPRHVLCIDATVQQTFLH